MWTYCSQKVKTNGFYHPHSYYCSDRCGRNRRTSVSWIFCISLAAILALLAYYFAFPLLNVEYEYSLLNHDLDIDAIYSKEKRKSKMNLDIQNAEIIAPKGSHRLDSYHPEATCDFSSGNANAKIFAIMIPINQKMTCVYIEPDKIWLNIWNNGWEWRCS